MDWIPERANELISSEMQDGTVIVSPADGHLSVVNPVGAFVWDLIDGQRSTDFIVDQVVQNFEVSPAVARADVLSFLDQLAERGLVTKKPQV